jgi:AraC-like DNA-binding protein
MSDPLSEVLAIVKARSELSTGLCAGGEWSVHVEPYTGLKFNVMQRGGAWLQLDGEAPLQLSEGDCFLLADGRGFTIASGLSLPPRPAHCVFAAAIDGIAQIGNTVDVEILAARMTLTPALLPFLRASLPPVTVISGRSEQAENVHWLLRRLRSERAHSELGSATLSDRVVEMLFVELMRAANDATDGVRDAAGWLGALSHPRLGRALRAIHAEPERTWTVAQLAELAHMSRSGFAATFKQAVGIAPLAYLTRWRLQQASVALRRNMTIAVAASDAGFASESAFSHAFRRVFGCSPRKYVQAR